MVKYKISNIYLRHALNRMLQQTYGGVKGQHLWGQQVHCLNHERLRMSHIFFYIALIMKSSEYLYYMKCYITVPGLSLSFFSPLILHFYPLIKRIENIFSKSVSLMTTEWNSCLTVTALKLLFKSWRKNKMVYLLKNIFDAATLVSFLYNGILQ